MSQKLVADFVSKMPSCSVAECSNSSKHNRKLYGDEKLSFFTFPNDPKRAKIWWLKCKRKDKQTYNKNDTVCSKHFGPNDFVSPLAEKYGLPWIQRRLCNTAIPSLNLPKTFSSKRNNRIANASKW